MGITKPLSQLSPGQRLGPYTIQRLIGRGRQSEVYQAARTGAQVDVALKVFLPGVIRGPSQAACFLEEAARIATLVHPNIARIYDCGCDAEKDLCYLATDRLAGPTLRDVLAAHRGGYGRDELWQLFEPIAQALAAAHEHHTVHGSIRPDHILLDQGSRPVLIDFDIPCLAQGAPASRAALPQVVTYWAPEQAAQLAPSPAADIYALGILLYELAVGDVPFKGNTWDALVRQHLYDPPEPPSQRRPDLDPRLERAILLALRKNPAERFISVREMLAVMSSASADDYATLTLDKRLASEVRRRSGPGARRAARSETPAPEPSASPAAERSGQDRPAWIAIGLGLALAVALLAIALL